MSNAEVAAVLEMSVGAVESLLVRARRTLRKTLA
jgi:DNA-directed RNA polymerase specialized sigma24 family protein